tara:strand:+ start:29434 stop:30273 length:840 start_codon:yes stop_codon:yes gene_type:complete
MKIGFIFLIIFIIIVVLVIAFLLIWFLIIKPIRDRIAAEVSASAQNITDSITPEPSDPATPPDPSTPPPECLLDVDCPNFPTDICVDQTCIPDGCTTNADCPSDRSCNTGNGQCICQVPAISSATVTTENWPGNAEFSLSGTNATNINITSYNWEIYGFDIGGENIQSSGSSGTNNILSKTGDNTFEIDWSLANGDSCTNLNDGFVFGCHEFITDNGCDFGTDYGVNIRLLNVQIENFCGVAALDTYDIEMTGMCGDPLPGAPFNADDGVPTATVVITP